METKRTEGNTPKKKEKKLRQKLKESEDVKLGKKKKKTEILMETDGRDGEREREE